MRVASTLIALVAAVGGDFPVGPPASLGQVTDTIRLEVGSRAIDGRVYRPHAARVRIRIGDIGAPVVSEWTNELTVGDSAGRPVHRWVTRGRRTPPAGPAVEWELRQTYDARTLAPLGYHYTSSAGAYTRLRIDGPSILGEKRNPGDTTLQTVNQRIDRPGFFAGATDLVPAAVGFKAGSVMTAPFWSPGMEVAETRIFSIRGRERVQVEGASIEAWKVEEFKTDGSRVATWFLLDHSPYMVYGEVPLPDGRKQVITEVEIPPS